MCEADKNLEDYMDITICARLLADVEPGNILITRGEWPAGHHIRKNTEGLLNYVPEGPDGTCEPIRPWCPTLEDLAAKDYGILIDADDETLKESMNDTAK